MKLLSPECFERLPAAVLFDTDNTLYPYNPAHRVALQAVRDKAVSRFAISPDTFHNAFEEARRQVKARLEGQAASHNRLLYMQRMLEIMGLGSQVLAALDLEQTYWRTFLSSAVLFDGIKDLLEELRLMGIPTAIVTDLTAQIQFRKIVYFGLDNYFDYVVTSEEAGHDKPHEAPFRIAVEKMRPKDGPIWMIGDSAAADMRGAKRAIHAVTLQKLHDGVEAGQGEARPDAVFDSFEALGGLLRRIAEKTGP